MSQEQIDRLLGPDKIGVNAIIDGFINVNIERHKYVKVKKS